MTDKQPADHEFTRKDPRNVIIYGDAIWCSLGDGAPFRNPIVNARLDDAGDGVWFMLDSRNFYHCKWGDTVEVCPYSYRGFPSPYPAWHDLERSRRSSLAKRLWQ